MSDDLKVWFAILAVTVAVAYIILATKANNDKSWAQTDDCTKRGGVMVTGAVNGCVRILPISTGE